ncbi:MAG: gldE [Chitinophagaceae bacterium]|nr:gldE [Chitinophagaceae bacterium]
MSGAEVAFFSLTHKDINLLKTKQQPGFKRIVDLMQNPKILLASLLIANSITNIGTIIIFNLLLDNFFSFEQVQPWLEFLIKVVAVTFVLVLFGEVMPKVLANQNNIRFAKDVSWLVETVQYLFRRLSRWMVKYSDIIEKKLAKKQNGYSLDELYHAIDITSGNENNKEGKNMLKGIAKFSNITVKQIMKTRMDVSGIDYDMTFDELIKKVEELHYSRLPVFKDDMDEVVGMLHTKDLLANIDQSHDFNWHGLMKQPFFVHEYKFIEDLLKEFQIKRIHFAVVVDEFGGTSGIVTLEDILEEIIGDIKDEFDEEDSGCKKIDHNNFLFEGKVMIHDACKFMDLPTDTFEGVSGESDSMAGLVLEIAGKIPQINEVITAGDFDFTVLEKEKNRLQRIKVSIKIHEA